MGRAVVWGLAIFGAFLAVVMLGAAVSGSFTEKQQIHLLVSLFKDAIIFGPLVATLATSIREYRQSGHWVAFIRSAIVMVFYVGAWAWLAYFANHGAFFLWPLLVGAVMLALLIVGAVVYGRLRREMTILPNPPNTSGAANPDDFKDWS